MRLIRRTKAFFEEIAKASSGSLIAEITSIDAFREECQRNFKPLATPFPAGVSRSDFKNIFLPTSSKPIRAEVYVPSDIEANGPLPTIIYFHGGGFCLSLNVHQPGCVTMARSAGAQIIMLDYPLAPEHTPKEITEMVYEAVKYLYQYHAAYNIDRENFIISGCSSGGNLAAVITNRSLTDPELNITQQVLLTPFVDASLETHLSNPYVEEQGADLLMTTAGIVSLVHGFYVPAEEDRKLPHISPIFNMYWVGLPPTFIAVGEYDGVRGDGYSYAQKIIRAGHDVTFVTVAGQTHNFTSCRGALNDPGDPDPSEMAGSFISSSLKKVLGHELR